MTNILYQDMSNFIFMIIIRHIIFTLAGKKSLIIGEVHFQNKMYR